MKTDTHRTSRLRIASLFLGGMTLIAVGLGSAFAAAMFADSSQPYLLGVLAWGLAAFNGVFHPYITRDDLVMLPKIVAATTLSALVVLVGELIATQGLVSIPGFLITTALTGITMIVGQLAGRAALRHLWRRGDYRSTAVLVGHGGISRELALELACSPSLGIDVVDYIDTTSMDPSSAAAALGASVERWSPDRLIIGEASAADDTFLGVLRQAGTAGTRVYVLPRLFEMGVGSPLFCPDRLRGFPLLRVNRSAHPHLAGATKRAMDVIASAGALLVLSPALALTALAVKLTSEGPILFWQERVGLGGAAIHVPKFRSMTTSETSDTEWTADARITPLGRLLRRSAIDELPQLWSVLVGDMSLVGPRPERPTFSEQFVVEHPGYEDRLRMRVGLTGLSQIAGLRGDTSIAERTKYDNLYIDQWTLAGDIVILLRTFGAIASERSRAREHSELEAAIQLHQHDDVVDLSTTTVAHDTEVVS